MADNYLEKRMDDYRNGRLSPTYRTQKLTPGGKPSGTVGFQLEVSRVFVAMECRQLRDAIARAFAGAGCRVAFCGTDRAAGTEAAQRFGLMFCPVDGLKADAVNRMLALVGTRWHGIEMVVTGIGAVAPESRAKMLFVTPADSYDRLAGSSNGGFSAVVYSGQPDGQLSGPEVKAIVENTLLQGCNASVCILTKLNNNVKQTIF